jgi:hypothetical protein
MKSNFKKKNQFFVTFTVIALLIMTAGPIRSSFELLNENNNIKDRLQRATSVIDELDLLKKESKNISRNFTSDNDNDNIRKEILLNMGEIEKKYNVTFRSLGDPLTYSELDLIVETYCLTFESDFSSSLKTIRSIEDKLVHGKISSTKFKSQYNRKKRRVELLTEVFIQRIRHHEN